MTWAFETSKPIPSDTIPPRRPQLLIFPKQFYPLGTKHSNRSAYGGYFHSDQHSVCIHLFCFYSKTATLARRKLSPTITRARFWYWRIITSFLCLSPRSSLSHLCLPVHTLSEDKYLVPTHSKLFLISLIVLFCVSKILFLSGLIDSHLFSILGLEVRVSVEFSLTHLCSKLG